MNTIYDYIIIGAGMAGLYMGHLLRDKKANVIILEAESSIGGRAQETKFYEQEIKTGAGIGSLTNIHLLKLLKKFNMKYNIFDGKVNKQNVSPVGNNWNIDSAVEQIVCKYKELVKEKNSDIKNLTVKEFIVKYFGNKFWCNYQKATDYNDYWESDICYYINYYPITDELTNADKLIYLSWTQLANHLAKGLNIKLSTPVKQIEKIDKNYLINKQYQCKNLIFAVSLEPLIKLYKQIDSTFNWENYVGAVPFSYIYTYHKEPHNVQNMTLVINEIKKSLAINNNVLMASYADNKLTNWWKQNYKKMNRKQFLSLINEKLKEVWPNISKAQDFTFIDWSEGVHYFRPVKEHSFKKLLNKLSHPTNNVYIIGEILSLRQGWVEGALESAERVFKNLS